MRDLYYNWGEFSTFPHDPFHCSADLLDLNPSVHPLGVGFFLTCRLKTETNCFTGVKLYLR